MVTRGLLLLALALGLASTAQAQGCDTYMFGWGGGWGGYRYVPTDRQMPYYAEFPPVYYSYPVPRTYGYSPYAYLPNVMTPEIEFAPEPLTIENPHAPTPAKPMSSDRTASFRRIEPQVIVNPFVTTNALAKAQLAR